MEGLLRDDAQFSQLESLVTQQRYDESLELLNDAIAKNPCDRHAYLFHLLVVRIVVLRRQFAARPRLRLSQPKLFLTGSTVGRQAAMAWRALVNAAGPCRPLAWLRTAADRVLSAGQRCRTACTGLRRRPQVIGAVRSGLFTGEQDLYPPLRRKPFRLATAFTLSLVAATAVFFVLLRSGDTSHREKTAARPRGTELSTVAQLAVSSLPNGEAKTQMPTPPAANPAAAGSVGRELAQVGGLQAPPRPRSESSTGEAKAAQKPAAQEAKLSPDVATHPSEAAAKKNHPAAPRNAMMQPRVPKKAASDTVAKASSLFYRARRPITVRQAARFAAPTVEKLSEGAIVAVLDVKNSWARVTLDGKAPGFVRIEHLGPVEIP